jgi:hypothetical protein
MSEKKLVSKLAKVMQEVKYIQKRGINKHFGYKYATEADVNEKVREELANQNVIMLPSMKSHSLRETKTKNGNTEYIACVDMDFTFVDGETGESLTISMSGEGQDNGDKAIYKAISGTQKYALMKVFMIPTGNDPEGDEGADERNNTNTNGNSGNEGQPPENVFSKPASEKQIGLVHKLLEDLEGLGSNYDAVITELKKQIGSFNKIEELTIPQASNAITVLKQWVDKKRNKGA